MKRWLPLAIVALCALGGCAPVTAPLPPLATPIADDPQEYHRGPVRWQADTVLTYAVREAQEVRLDDGVTTEATERVVEYRVVERTTEGQVRVRVTQDGAEVAHVLLDRDGDPVDVTPTNPAYALAGKAMLHLMRHAEIFAEVPTQLRRGEPVQVTLPGWLVGIGAPPWARPGLPERLVMEWVFTGQVRVREALATALTARSANLLTRQVCDEPAAGMAQVCLDDLRVETTEYRDPASGHLVVEYDLTTATGNVEGAPVAFRITTLTTLDRARSRGW